MKIQNNILRLRLVVFIVLVSGCMQSTESVTTPVLPTLVATKESPTLTPIVAETISPSPTIVPTLPINEARKRLLVLLTDNGGCRLPCLWGITPGKSTYQEAQATFVPLSVLSVLTSFIPEGGAIFPIYPHGDLTLNINAGFSVNASSDNQIVSRVGFQARELKKVDNMSTDVFDSPFFVEQLGYYMLPNILTQYGEPTTVMLSTMAKLPSSGVPGGFKILLLYPDQGILVNYTMQMQIVGESIMGCPSNSHIEFELYPPGHADSFFDLLEPSGWTQIIQKTYKPIEEATSMSQEDFYRIFSQQTNECILTPASLWPAPN